MEKLIEIFSDPQISWIVVLIVVDYVLGFVAAVNNKEWRLGKVAKVMKGPVLWYLLGFGVVKVVAEAQPSFEVLVPLVWLIIIGALVGSILDNLAKFGIKIPDWLKK